MRRTLPPLLVAALAALLLAGCTAQDPVDRAALEQWKTDHDSAADDDLGVLAADVDPADPSPSSKDGITITFPEPEDIDHLEFTCFGDGTMSGGLTIRSGSTSRNTQSAEPMSCVDGTQRFPLPRTWRKAVEEVTFDAYDASKESTWQLRIVGG
ncbi:hypothetical protein SAMN02800687_3058 [Curtobacterium sp. UNCCL20]|uniref:hypothetical protein n=1 Tax=Curtobacterium sp. UNCCL20 TaxID=1502773 RepID=UPI00087E0F21|nr:hypothetical protein [Curtobacterium sp. UNCCL20]SDQ91117.1 hypothetical protein SAMN02800687_3058 [Curtobacterium sp. UNCCL20]